MRGEDQRIYIDSWEGSGSPPREWGGPHLPAEVVGGIRITPTFLLGRDWLRLRLVGRRGCRSASGCDRPRLRRAGPPALRPGAGLRRPGLPALDPGAPGCWRPALGVPSPTGGNQTAPAWSSRAVPARRDALMQRS